MRWVRSFVMWKLFFYEKEKTFKLGLCLKKIFHDISHSGIPHRENLHPKLWKKIKKDLVVSYGIFSVNSIEF